MILRLTMYIIETSAQWYLLKKLLENLKNITVGRLKNIVVGNLKNIAIS